MPTSKSTQKQTSQKATSADVLAMIDQYGLEATPENYHLFYEFLNVQNTALIKEMQQQIDDGQIDQPVCDDLYYKHLKGLDLTDKALNTGAKMGREMKAVLKMLAAAEHNTAEYEKTLSGASGLLNEPGDAASYKKLIDNLIEATAKMQAHTHELEERLNKTTNEVTVLRNNLEEVREEAMTDSLTGIANRRRFDECLRRMREHAIESGEDLSLVLCDIDNFKRFNDTWGHQTGDQIIRFVASSLKRHAPRNHIVARYGGEEFAVLMPDTDVNTSFDIADNVRAVVESKKLVRKSTNEDLGTITISLGVTNYDSDEQVEEFIERADIALYSSKKSGRNKVTANASDDKSLNVA